MASWGLGLVATFFALAGSPAHAAAAADPARPPVEAFFRNADMSAAQLSPSGRWLAVATGTASARVVLVVVDLERKVAPAVVANFTDADVDTFNWVNDDRLVFQILDLQRGLGDQQRTSGMFSVRLDGSERRRLILPLRMPISFERSVGVPPLDRNHALLFVPQTGGDEVVVGEYRWDGRGDVDRVNPIRLNVVTGRTSAFGYTLPDGIRQWVFDPQGEPRAAVRIARGETEVLWRGPADSAWRTLAKYPRSAPGIWPVSVDTAGQLFVEVAGARGEGVLKRFDFAAGQADRDPLVSTPGFDFDGRVITDRSSQRALGVRVRTDAETTLWFDPAMKKIQALADARFPGRINRLSCFACGAGGNVLVNSFSDQDAGSYWIYRPGADEWESVGKRRKDLDPARMAQLDFFRAKARDGQDLPIWLTTPPGKAAAPRPAVVLVHGGPWVRGGYWGWSADAQFLASRGYVVIEPEFRGSTGYGFEHFRSGWKQWGTTMQDDVADAMQWAVAKGLVDPKRVCVAGASYGGYATLMSLVRHPGLYRCGVAWVAVADPRLLMAETFDGDISHDSRNYTMPELIGDPDKDADLLKAATPADRAAEIRVPVLMAFGRADRRVPIEHGNRMRSAMRTAGNEPEWVVYDDEGHGWLKVENRIDFWQRVEKFLDKQLR